MADFSDSSQESKSPETRFTDEQKLPPEHDSTDQSSAFWEFVQQESPAEPLHMYNDVAIPFSMLAPAEHDFAALLADADLDVHDLSEILPVSGNKSPTKETTVLVPEQGLTTVYPQTPDIQYQNTGYMLPSIHEISNFSPDYPPPVLEYESFGVPISSGMSGI